MSQFENLYKVTTNFIVSGTFSLILKSLILPILSVIILKYEKVDPLSSVIPYLRFYEKSGQNFRSLSFTDLETD